MNQSPHRYRFGPPGGVTIGPPGPVPPMVKALIVANVVIHIVSLLDHARLTYTFGVVPNRITGLEPLGLLNLFTYQFLHGGPLHLLLNMLALWMFGSELEERWGSKFFLKYYILCGVGGGLAYGLLAMGGNAPSVGASGAVYGLLLAYGMWFPNRVLMLFFVFPVRVRTAVMILVALTVLMALDPVNAGIAHTAHLGGMAAGYLYLRSWGTRGGGGLGLPGLNEAKRAYYRWKLKRLQKKRWGTDNSGPTIH